MDYQNATCTTSCSYFMPFDDPSRGCCSKGECYCLRQTGDTCDYAAEEQNTTPLIGKLKKLFAGF